MTTKSHTNYDPRLLLLFQFLTQLVDFGFRGLPRQLYRKHCDLFIWPGGAIVTPNKVNQILRYAHQRPSTALNLIRELA